MEKTFSGISEYRQDLNIDDKHVVKQISGEKALKLFELFFIDKQHGQIMKLNFE